MGLRTGMGTSVLAVGETHVTLEYHDGIYICIVIIRPVGHTAERHIGQALLFRVVTMS